MDELPDAAAASSADALWIWNVSVLDLVLGNTNTQFALWVSDVHTCEKCM